MVTELYLNTSQECHRTRYIYFIFNFLCLVRISRRKYQHFQVESGFYEGIASGNFELVLRCEFNIHHNLKLSRIPAFTWSTQDLFFLYESLTQIWPRWSEKVGLGLLGAKIDEWFVQVDWCSSPSGRSWQQFERSSYPASLDSTRPLADKLTGDRYTQESGRYQFYFSDL